MNYTVQSIKIPSSWFDYEENKKNTYQKITYKGLYIYFLLYKFRVHNQKNEHTFFTTITMLRKESGYTTDEIFDLLKKLKSANVLKFNNLSKWSYLIDQTTGQIKDKEMLIIEAVKGLPIFDKVEKGVYFITINFDLFEKYNQLKMNERYFALYCLINKWNNNTEGKMYMSIDKIADCLLFDKDTVHRMIYTMNRNYMLSSYRRKRKNADGYFFEHYLLSNLKESNVQSFLESHRDNMDKLIKRMDRRKKQKKAINIEKELEVISDDKEEVWGENEQIDELLEQHFG